LIVVAARILTPDTIRVADENGFDAAILAEINNLSSPLVAQVANTALMM
jgi:hypothetical protein